jgi:hypothetical protein
MSRIRTRVSAALAVLAMIHSIAPAGAQGGGQGPGPRGNPGGNVMVAPAQPPADPAPARRVAPPIPNYYFDRSPVVRPKAPVGPAPNDLASSLRARGFRDIGPMQQRGSTSITEAVGPAGERVQLVIAPNGDIVGVRVLDPRER